MFKSIESFQIYFGKSNLLTGYNDFMENLDLLIAKFKEVKEELVKADSGLHGTVEGFMGGLKALPKGSAERGKFITAHMNHAPFITAMSNHPQGKQLHATLTSHLNSAANAGFKPGAANVVVKSEDVVDDLEKALLSPKAQAQQHAMYESSKAVAPKAAEPAPKMPSTTERSARANMLADFTPSVTPKVTPAAPAKKLTGIDKIKAQAQKPIIKNDIFKQETAKKDYANQSFEKTVNGTPPPPPPSQSVLPLLRSCGEKVSLNKGGQWNLDKTEDGRSGSEKLCSKCHAKKCQCTKDGVLVD
jgi:uncharacterized phage infection (PIP) family protein YhgE